MFGPLRSHLTRSARRLIVCCLLVSVPLYGLSGSLVDLLGNQHVHRSAAAVAAVVQLADATLPGADAGLVDFRRLGTTRAHVEPSHGHSHGDFERHHHDHDDATVIALDGGHRDSASADEGGSSAAAHVLALTALPSLTLPPLPAFAWAAAGPSRVQPWIADGMERPPKA